MNKIKSTITIGTPEDRDFLDNKIIEYNLSKVPATQTEKFINLDYVINDNKTVIGGVTGVLYCWNCLYINVLWVDDRYRKNGLGSQLLHKIEQRAKEMNCRLSHLDTFDFQAKEFYLKHGYEVFGELENCPSGHKRYYLKKCL